MRVIAITKNIPVVGATDPAELMATSGAYTNGQQGTRVTTKKKIRMVG